MSYNEHFVRLSSQLGCSVRCPSPYAPRPWKPPRFKIALLVARGYTISPHSSASALLIATQIRDDPPSSNAPFGIRQIISLPTRWPSDCKNYQCHIDDSCATLVRSCGGPRAPTDPLLRGGIKSFLSRLSAQSLALSSNLAPAQRPNERRMEF
jgi:hypothetical protein